MRGSVFDSAVVNQIEPVHTPAAPSAIAAAIWRPGSDSARGENGCRGDRIHHIRNEYHPSDIAGMAPCFVALSDDNVDALLYVTDSLIDTADQRADLDALAMSTPDDLTRRGTQR